MDQQKGMASEIHVSQSGGVKMEPQKGMSNQMIMILAFAAGVAVGMNWPKIQKIMGPMIANVTDKSADVFAMASKFFAEQKEAVEDKVAATKVRKVKKVKKAAKA